MTVNRATLTVTANDFIEDDAGTTAGAVAATAFAGWTPAYAVPAGSSGSAGSAPGR